jgi:ATP-dependent DNA ligase
MWMFPSGVRGVDEGRVSFNLLQHHRSEASAIQFYAFDLLIHRGKSLLQVPLATRTRVQVYPCACPAAL